MKIKFFDLQREIFQHQTQVNSKITEVIESGHFILGPQLKIFETNFAQYIGVNYATGVNSGLDALIIALLSSNIKPEDEVIVPSHTFIATWLAIYKTGAKIIPVEPDESYNISIDNILNKLTPRTKFIVIVHLYGRPFDIIKLREKIKGHKCLIIEDAAQAHGSSINNIRCGAMGDAAAFSFYPTKNLGAIGDGGIITTNQQRISTKALKLRNYGSSKKYHHELDGFNTRLDEIQASVLNYKLKFLDALNKRKSNIVRRFNKELSNPKIKTPLPQGKNQTIAWHLYVLKVEERTKFISYMQNHGIETMIHYPIPPHKSEIFSSHYTLHNLSYTEELSQTLISLPLYSTLSDTETSYIIDVVNSY